MTKTNPHLTQIVNVLDHSEMKVREIGAQAFLERNDWAVEEAQDVIDALGILRSQIVDRSQRDSLSSPQDSPEANDKKTLKISTNEKKYPRFEIRNHSLVRTAHSNKTGLEYEHKVPRETFNRVIDGMNKMTRSSSGPFNSEEITANTTDGESTVPSYQIYSVLGLLRKHQCIAQVSRGNYMIPKDISTKALSIWTQLEAQE